MLNLTIGKITLQFSDDTWCRVGLYVENQCPIKLGALSRGTLLNRLLAACEDPDELEHSRIVDGLKRFAIVALAENHTSIQISEPLPLPNRSRCLFFHDAKGKEIISLEIDSATLEEWGGAATFAPHAFSFSKGV